MKVDVMRMQIMVVTKTLRGRGAPSSSSIIEVKGIFVVVGVVPVPSGMDGVPSRDYSGIPMGRKIRQTRRVPSVTSV